MAKVFGPEYMTHSLEVLGLVNHPLRLELADLRALPQTEVQNLSMICGSGRNLGHIESYRGVRLTAVLEKADVIMREHDAPNWIYVTVSSSDGHWALFSYQELFNTEVGDQAIVILEKDGRPLDASEGEIAFVSARDLRPGPRKLRYLQRVVVLEHPASGGAAQ
jgi:DMSO/TMAO reductase YedYZ molybdopterin-dependent catalytic subunit